MLEHTLDVILMQEYPLKLVELIVVDVGLRDTIKIIQAFQEKHCKKFNHNKNYGVSKARNDGIRISKGKM